MDLSIVTPSFNQLAYLKRCCASVRDQAGPTHEHIVVDAVSTDGTVEWLRTAPCVTSIVEKDRGMYDAVNKGLRQATGEIVAYLNCDEQYLPGTLAFVKQYFDEHPAIDAIFGNVLVIRPDGTLIAYRKAHPAVSALIMAHHLYIFSSALFLRRRIIDAGELFDPQYKDVGDEEFVLRLLRKGYRMKHVRRYLSAFTATQENRSQLPYAVEEGNRLDAQFPAWVSRYRYPLNALRLLLKLLSGAYVEHPPLRYAIYTSDVDRGRTWFTADKLSPRFRLA